jgi:hypothetical protein
MLEDGVKACISEWQCLGPPNPEPYVADRLFAGEVSRSGNSAGLNVETDDLAWCDRPSQAPSEGQ